MIWAQIKLYIIWAQITNFVYLTILINIIISPNNIALKDLYYLLLGGLRSLLHITFSSEIFITYYFLCSLFILFITFFKHVAIFQAWSIGSFLCIIKLAKRMHLSFFDPVSSRLALLNRLLSTESLLVAMGLPAESLPVYFLEIVAQ